MVALRCLSGEHPSRSKNPWHAFTGSFRGRWSICYAIGMQVGLQDFWRYSFFWEKEIVRGNVSSKPFEVTYEVVYEQTLINVRNILRFREFFEILSIFNISNYFRIFINSLHNIRTTLNLIFWRPTRNTKNTTHFFSNTFERSRTFPKFQAMHQAISQASRDIRESSWSILPPLVSRRFTSHRVARFHKSINWNRCVGRLVGWRINDTDDPKEIQARVQRDIGFSARLNQIGRA